MAGNPLDLSDAEKRALLAGLLAGQSAAAANDAPPARRPDPAAPERLSPAQERLWFLAQIEPESDAYHLCWRLRVSGALDVAAWQRSLDELVRRHPSLRTTFRAGDAPVQTVSPAASLAVVVEDWSALPPDERAAAVDRRCELAAQAPFDLARGPLVRAAVLRAATDEHVLLLVVHHIAFDGWSFGVMVRELSQLYEAFRAGRPSPLPEPLLHYADVAAWQWQRLTPARLETLLTYWTRQLRGLPPRLELPFDRPRSQGATRGQRRSRQLPERLARAVEAASRSEGVTPFMTLVSACFALLHRYSGQRDLIVGSPVTGRPHVELEELIGCFMNLVVLRAEVGDHTSFRALLGQMRATTLAAQTHQELPYQRLVEALHPGRERGGARLFQVTFQLHGAPEPWRLPGLEVRADEPPALAAKFDLSLSVELGDGVFALHAEYASDRFDAATIERVLAHYQSLLDAALRELDTPIASLAFGESGTTHRAVASAGGCLHRLFEEQVRRTPDAIAATFGTTHWSYDTLNRRANRIARLLSARGAGRESRVALCSEPSLELLAGMLAILKVGAAYVPLDPAYPEARLDHLVRDAGATLGVTWGHHLDKLALAQPLNLDACAAELAAASDTDLDLAVHPEQLAYLLHTSGSAGQPKGVMVEHRQVPDLFRDLPLGDAPETQVWALAHACSFDASVWEIWGALTSGARLVVVPSEIRSSPPALETLLLRERVTVLLQTPSAFRQLGALPPLRLLLLGGEAVDFARLHTFMSGLEGRTVVCNAYGPTEGAVYATLRPITWDELDRVPGSMLGGAHTGRELHVLDRELRPVPVGVCGEIYLGGSGVARGYLGNPALTAELFVPSPFGPAGARLYRTGDLARRTAGGDVQFLGRADQQLKVRGFRIEPGEIERALEQHARVREVVVVAREHPPGEPRPVAYVVAREEDAACATPPASLIPQLRFHARRLLPEHLVPSAFVLLDALPRSESGKLDRGALPQPDASADRGLEYVAPETEVEQALAALWTEVLGVERIGAHDNFFDLGGHSLVATRLMSRVRARFAVELSLRRLFETPTLSGLAQAIEDRILGRVHDA